MLKYWQFDLVKWLAGETRSTASLVLSMIHQLPEGSIYVAIKSEPTDDDGPDLDPKLVDQYNRQVWTSQMYALAEIANRITYLINMKLPKSATPLEPYGPSAGTDKPVEKKKNVFDIMGYFGG